jgi:hypothetical protein
MTAVQRRTKCGSIELLVPSRARGTHWQITLDEVKQGTPAWRTDARNGTGGADVRETSPTMGHLSWLQKLAQVSLRRE